MVGLGIRGRWACRAAALALLCPGCTVIRIHGAERVEVAAGVLSIVPAPGAKMVAYHATGIGVVPGLNGATLGVHRERGALIFDADDCRVVVLDAPEDARAAAILRDAAAACSKGGTP